MIELLALLLQPTLESLPPQSTSGFVASVRYDCAVVDETGRQMSLKLLKTGRMTVIGEYGELQRTTTDLPFIEPEYRVVEGSDPRFASMLQFAPPRRQIGWHEFVRSTDDSGEFSGMFELLRHELSTGIDPVTGQLSGSAIIMYMPRPSASEQTETLGGVCVATRLEDQPK
ncbi:MAG: hypothetical protein CVT85_04385 [Alphaproteobacteria bacterium HGW-Alphaproteobacteria-7]|jgi:hypothetical protein|nr:MAG: hypothetical protein CVT85_04385 [Alphaproteobacteria bacterium HGW-Alphaproteobacteria-7]